MVNEGPFFVTETTNEVEEINGEETFPVVRLTFIQGMPGSEETDRFQEFLGKRANSRFWKRTFRNIQNHKRNGTFDIISGEQGINHTVMSNLDANPEWFSYLFIPVSETEFYISDGGGFEGIPQFKYFNKKSALNFNEAVRRTWRTNLK